MKDNPSVPLSVSVTYLPDQLVFDLKNAVTQTATISGPAVLKRGTVLGMITRNRKPSEDAVNAAAPNATPAILLSFSLLAFARTNVEG